MTSDPYSKLIQQMKEQGQSVNPPSIQVGQVISVSPLTIRIGDLQIDKSNILVADYLLSGYSRKTSLNHIVSGNTENTEITDHGNHRHRVNNLSVSSGTTTFTDTLKNNDRLAILSTEDKQLYIVLARVVSI